MESRKYGYLPSGGAVAISCAAGGLLVLLGLSIFLFVRCSPCCDRKKKHRRIMNSVLQEQPISGISFSSHAYDYVGNIYEDVMLREVDLPAKYNAMTDSMKQQYILRYDSTGGLYAEEESQLWNQRVAADDPTYVSVISVRPSSARGAGGCSTPTGTDSSGSSIRSMKESLDSEQPSPLQRKMSSIPLLCKTVITTDVHGTAARMHVPSESSSTEGISFVTASEEMLDENRVCQSIVPDIVVEDWTTTSVTTTSVTTTSGTTSTTTTDHDLVGRDDGGLDDDSSVLVYDTADDAPAEGSAPVANEYLPVVIDSVARSSARRSLRRMTLHRQFLRQQRQYTFSSSSAGSDPSILGVPGQIRRDLARVGSGLQSETCVSASSCSPTSSATSHAYESMELARSGDSLRSGDFLRPFDSLRSGASVLSLNGLPREHRVQRLSSGAATSSSHMTDDEKLCLLRQPLHTSTPAPLMPTLSSSTDPVFALRSAGSHASISITPWSQSSLPRESSPGALELKSFQCVSL